MKTTTVFFSVVCLIFAALSLVLLNQNLRLKEQVRKSEAALPGQYLQRLGEFQILPADEPSGKLQNSFWNCVEGVATNISGRKLTMAIVGFQLRDKSGNQVDYLEASTQNLDPHGTWKFKTRKFDARLNPVCIKFEGVVDVND